MSGAAAKRTELYGTRGCPYTAELRDDLEWRGVEFLEYDVEQDQDARKRLRGLVGGSLAVPVLVEDGQVVSIGWQGRSCYVGMEN